MYLHRKAPETKATVYVSKIKLAKNNSATIPVFRMLTDDLKVSDVSTSTIEALPMIL